MVWPNSGNKIWNIKSRVTKLPLTHYARVHFASCMTTVIAESGVRIVSVTWIIKKNTSLFKIGFGLLVFILEGRLGAFSFVDIKQLSCSKGNASDNTTHVNSGKNYEKNVCNSSELSVGRHKTELNWYSRRGTIVKLLQRKSCKLFKKHSQTTFTQCVASLTCQALIVTEYVDNLRLVQVTICIWDTTQHETIIFYISILLD